MDTLSAILDFGFDRSILYSLLFNFPGIFLKLFVQEIRIEQAHSSTFSYESD